MAYRLEIHSTTVNRAFHHVLHVLYYRIVPDLIEWPDRDALIKNSMPYYFREAFGEKVVVIVDCFELFTENPTGAKDQVAMFSS